MPRDKGVFRFKQFGLKHAATPMKVGTDGVLLGAWAEHDDPRRILDIGCGCGLIGLMLAQRFPNAEVVGLDLNPEAVQEARENASASPFSVRVEIQEGDILTQEFGLAFDLVVCNPPYFSKSMKTPLAGRNLARHQDSLPLSALMKKAEEVLNSEGIFCLILPVNEMAKAEKEAVLLGFHLIKRCEVSSRESEPCVRTMCAWTKNNALTSSIETTSIFLYDSDGKRSLAYAELTAEFYL